MVVFPNAKINLGLNIISRRKDGYHNIETCFLPIPYYDILEIIPSDHFGLTLRGIPIRDPSINLVEKAYHLLKYDFGLPPVDILLFKNIPIGSGLGGGSADGAFTLKALNQLFDLNLNPVQLRQYASRLGSDCAFFIENKAAIASGAGDRLETVDLNLNDYYVAIFTPTIHISTATAYQAVTPDTKETSLREVVARPVTEWKSQLRNDFEEFAFSKHPEIKKIKDDLYDSGALYASLSGSGSSVFGIFKNKPSLDINGNHKILVSRLNEL